jgi:hypothetical protein
MAFRQTFWNPRPGNERILCRVNDDFVRSELEELIWSIGQKYVDFEERGLSAANEMI